MPKLFEMSKYFYEKGDRKNLLIDVKDVGQYVARIVADERTLNRYVIAWGTEMTQAEVFSLAREISGQDIVPTPVSLL